MKAVDTNILIRFLIGDDEGQGKKVYAIFEKVESGKKVCAVARDFRSDLVSLRVEQ